MNKLTDIGTIKKILSHHGFTFSKALGQNFLINPSICPKMAEQTGIIEHTGAIEIGPGIGVLTRELAKRAEKVVAIELDKRLLPILKETLSEFNNVKIINDDVMKIDLKALINEEFPYMNVVVCANLPYYVTTPILMRLLENRLKIRVITVMVQKEVAQRICSGAGRRTSGSISLAVDYFAVPEILFTVKSGSFMPAPKVDSAVVRLTLRKEPACKVSDEKLFFKIIKMSFSQRRKTILNSLGNNLKIPKDMLLKVINEIGISPLSRAEDLSLEDFAKLCEKITDIAHS